MALSLSNFLYAICGFIFFSLSNAATVTYNWNVTWVTANPDGMFDRRTMGINGQWPNPVVNITKGDQVIVNLYNGLGDQSTSLHFHGLFQNGSTEMDGVVGVTQCGVPPGGSFTYNFTVDQPGTYWYHSHERGQYPDGLRGPVVVHDPDSPYLGKYAQEFTLSLSDWYHDQMQDLLGSFISLYNPTGAEPVPDSALMNDAQNGTFPVEPNTTYLFHIVNMGAFAGQYLWIEGHQMQIVEVDGVWTEAQEADMIYITAAQRYSILVTSQNQTTQNFAIVGSMDQDLFDTVPPTLNPNVTSYLQYNPSAPLSPPTTIDTFNPYDDFSLVPYDHEPLWENPTQTIEMTMMMGNLGDGANYAFINDVTYVRPKVPTLYTALSAGNWSTNPAIYGVNSNAFVLGYNEVVEIVLNNNDPGKHPFHLHGHTFQTLIRSSEDAGAYTTASSSSNSTTLPAIPMRRDTLMVRPNGHFVVRFRSDNPGIWLFHCHIEWHVDSGLIATIVEAPLQLQAQKADYYTALTSTSNTSSSSTNLSNSTTSLGNPIDPLTGLHTLNIPANHYQVCADTKTPTAGNAAGNTEHWLDLTGANVSVKPLPNGFTAKGIVALVFSAISGILGMCVIGWYGRLPISGSEVRKAEEIIHGAGLRAPGEEGEVEVVDEGAGGRQVGE